MCEICEIPAGEYEIGDDSIPNAGPRHLHSIRTAFWIDATPVTWRHFDVFVVSGGYRRDELWTGLGDVDWRDKNLPSVDARCRQLLAAADAFRQPSGGLKPSLQQPITGINWFEASAMARFYGARLPCDVEWEIAMSCPAAQVSPSPRVVPHGRCAPNSISRFGCSITLGIIQEWTGDLFTPMYWRADFNQRGVPWSPTAAGVDVVVRGAGPEDLYQHISFRTGRAPDTGSEIRGFRRAWDTPPVETEVAAEWKADGS